MLLSVCCLFIIFMVLFALFRLQCSLHCFSHISCTHLSNGICLSLLDALQLGLSEPLWPTNSQIVQLLFQVKHLCHLLSHYCCSKMLQLFIASSGPSWLYILFHSLSFLARLTCLLWSEFILSVSQHGVVRRQGAKFKRICLLGGHCLSFLRWFIFL